MVDIPRHASLGASARGRDAETLCALLLAGVGGAARAKPLRTLSSSADDAWPASLRSARGSAAWRTHKMTDGSDDVDWQSEWTRHTEQQ